MRHFQQRRMAAEADAYMRAGIEPSLNEVLCDPMVHLVMARDRVAPDELLRLVAVVRRGRGAVKPKAPERVCA